MAGSNRRLYSSLDGGRTWQLIPGINGLYLSLYFLNSLQGYAAGFNGLAFTSDGGKNWMSKPLPSNVTNTQSWVNVQFATPSTGFLTTGAAIYKTNDTGTTWININPVHSNGVFFSDETTGWAYTDPDSISMTTDGGSHWHTISTIPTMRNVQTDLYTVLQFTDFQHGWFMDADSLSSSNDGGLHWTSLSTTNNGDATIFTDFQMLDNQNGYLATPVQIMKTTDGGYTWKQDYKISPASIISIFFLDAHYGWACCRKGIVLKYHQ